MGDKAWREALQRLFDRQTAIAAIESVLTTKLQKATSFRIHSNTLYSISSNQLSIRDLREPGLGEQVHELPRPDYGWRILHISDMIVSLSGYCGLNIERLIILDVKSGDELVTQHFQLYSDVVGRFGCESFVRNNSRYLFYGHVYRNHLCNLWVFSLENRKWVGQMKEIQDLQAGGIGINIDFELDDADFLYVVSNMQHKNSSRTKETICYYRYYRFSAKMSESDQIRPTEFSRECLKYDEWSTMTLRRADTGGGLQIFEHIPGRFHCTFITTNLPFEGKTRTNALLATTPEIQTLPTCSCQSTVGNGFRFNLHHAFLDLTETKRTNAVHGMMRFKSWREKNETNLKILLSAWSNIEREVAWDGTNLVSSGLKLRDGSMKFVWSFDTIFSSTQESHPRCLNKVENEATTVSTSPAKKRRKR